VFYEQVFTPLDNLKTRIMKIKPASVLQAIGLFLILILISFLIPGCKSADGARRSVLFNTSTNSIENKAYIVTRIAVAKVIENRPNATPKLQIAADDLLILENSPTLTVEPILAIIHRLPPDTFKDPNTGLYIEASVLFFTDELGTVGAENPPQLRAAARGMRRGIETFIPKPN